MKPITLAEHIAVSEQVVPGEIAEIAAMGYKVLVNNRPDGEAPGQPASTELEAAARAEGLAYYYLPVTAMDFPGPDAATLKNVFSNPAHPVFAFCRTGTRCANLWVVTRDEDAREASFNSAQALGFDMAMAARYLAGSA